MMMNLGQGMSQLSRIVGCGCYVADRLLLVSEESKEVGEGGEG